MEEHPSAVLDRMNSAYNAVYGTLSCETRMKAEKTFYACHDWLRSHSRHFHQSLSGKWVFEEEKTQNDHKAILPFNDPKGAHF